jgi:hypothetical protein
MRARPALALDPSASGAELDVRLDAIALTLCPAWSLEPVPDIC